MAAFIVAGCTTEGDTYITFEYPEYGVELLWPLPNDTLKVFGYHDGGVPEIFWADTSFYAIVTHKLPGGTVWLRCYTCPDGFGEIRLASGDTARVLFYGLGNGEPYRASEYPLNEVQIQGNAGNNTFWNSRRVPVVLQLIDTH